MAYCPAVLQSQWIELAQTINKIGQFARLKLYPKHPSLTLITRRATVSSKGTFGPNWGAMRVSRPHYDTPELPLMLSTYAPSGDNELWRFEVKTIS